MSTGLFRVIAIIGQKGGTGKTTTTVELAVTAANAGETVAVIDLDPQANAANWKDRREADNPYVVATPPGRLKQTIDAARTAEAEPSRTSLDPHPSPFPQKRKFLSRYG